MENIVTIDKKPFNPEQLLEVVTRQHRPEEIYNILDEIEYILVSTSHLHENFEDMYFAVRQMRNAIKEGITA